MALREAWPFRLRSLLLLKLRLPALLLLLLLLLLLVHLNLDGGRGSYNITCSIPYGSTNKYYSLYSYHRMVIISITSSININILMLIRTIIM